MQVNSPTSPRKNNEKNGKFINQMTIRTVRSFEKIPIQPKIRNNMLLYLWAVGISMGALISGYLFVIVSILSSSLTQFVQIQGNMKINMPLYISICTTALSVGGLAGSIAYPFFLKKAGGENRLMLFSDLCMIVLLLFQLINLDIYQHTFTRLIQGAVVGVYGIVVPSYLMSISPTKISGQIASFNQIMITIGIAIGYCMGYLIDQNDLSNIYNWRICVLVPLPMCLIRAFIGQSFAFDRIQTHIQRKQWNKLFDYVEKFYEEGTFSLEDLIRSKNISVQQIGYIPKTRLDFTKNQGKNMLNPVLKQKQIQQITPEQIKLDEQKPNTQSPSLKLRQRVAISLCFVSQFCGINAIIFYANQLFLDISEGDTDYAVKKSVQLGFFQIFVTLISGAFMDNFGRRTLMIGGSLLIILALMSGYYMLDFDADSKWDPQYVTYSVFLHIAGFSLSYGPITVVYISQILDDISSFMTLIWIQTIFISLTSNIMIQKIGTGKLFFIYGMVTLIGLAYIQKVMLQTKGKTRQLIVQDYDRFSKNSPQNFLTDMVSDKKKVQYERISSGQKKSQPRKLSLL